MFSVCTALLLGFGIPATCASEQASWRSRTMRRQPRAATEGSLNPLENSVSQMSGSYVRTLPERLPQPGELVQTRSRRWLVDDVSASWDSANAPAPRPTRKKRAPLTPINVLRDRRSPFPDVDHVLTGVKAWALSRRPALAGFGLDSGCAS